MIDLPVPFVSNTSDNRHCYQACIKMLLHYFHSEADVSLQELDKITKISHHYTWPYAGDLWLQSQGIHVLYITNFDHERFSEIGAKYLYEYADEKVAEDQIKNSDIKQEQELAKIVTKKIIIEKRIPVISDIKYYLEQGSLLLCNMNAYKLAGEEGYEGHAVLIRGYDEENLIINDPGLPAQENLHIPYKSFEEAWAYPDERVKNLSIYRI